MLTMFSACGSTRVLTDAQHNLPHIWQGGLGMPDRESLHRSVAENGGVAGPYQSHIAAILKLAGIADAESKATRILSLEIRMAQAHAPDADAADVFKQNNPWKRADFPSKRRGWTGTRTSQSAGLGGQTDFIVWQPSAVIGTSALVKSESTGCVEGLSHLSSDRTLCQRLAQGCGC